MPKQATITYVSASQHVTELLRTVHTYNSLLSYTPTQCASPRLNNVALYSEDEVGYFERSTAFRNRLKSFKVLKSAALGFSMFHTLTTGLRKNFFLHLHGLYITRIII